MHPMLLSLFITPTCVRACVQMINSAGTLNKKCKYGVKKKIPSTTEKCRRGRNFLLPLILDSFGRFSQRILLSQVVLNFSIAVINRVTSFIPCYKGIGDPLKMPSGAVLSSLCFAVPVPAPGGMYVGVRESVCESGVPCTTLRGVEAQRYAREAGQQADEWRSQARKIQ